MMVEERRQDLSSPTLIGEVAVQTIRLRFATNASIAGKCGSNAPSRRENSMNIGHHFGCVNW
jgi:hypothetical protein